MGLLSVTNTSYRVEYVWVCLSVTNTMPSYRVQYVWVYLLISCHHTGWSMYGLCEC